MGSGARRVVGHGGRGSGGRVADAARSYADRGAHPRGGPMEAGKTKLADKVIKLDLVDAIYKSADPTVSAGCGNFCI